MQLVPDLFGLDHKVVPVSLQLSDLVLLFLVELTVSVLSLHVKKSVHVLNGFELMLDV
jgi:hypothetical protein